MRTLKILLILLTSKAFAQFELKAVVHSTDNIAVPFANAIVRNIDNKIIAGVVTNESGEFIIMLQEGTYNLTLSFVGYNDYVSQIEIKNNTDLGVIVLTPQSTSLNEVIIFRKKQLIVRKIDRIIFNIEENPLINGGDANDAIKKSPGIIFKDGQFAMIGKSSVRVMIDGKMLELDGEDLTTYLSTIPVDNIKEVEVITNPSAKYDAQGNSGIINIIFKKGRRNAWNNKTTYVYNQAFYSNHRLNNNFTYNKDKISFIVGLNAKTGYTDIIKKSNTYYSSGEWSQYGNDKSNDGNYSGNIDFNYKINDKNEIGVKYLGSKSTPNVSDKTETKVFNTAQNLESILFNNGYTERTRTNNSLNFNYEKKIDTLGRSINFDFDYFNYKSDLSRLVETNRNVVSLPTEIIFSNKILTNHNVDNFSFKTDIEHPIKFAKISYGAKLSFINTSYDTMNFNTIIGQSVFDPLQSNEFTYKENIQAVYINGVKSLNDKLEMQLGFRIENTVTQSFSKRNNQTNENKFLNIFPTFYVSYQPNEKNTFNINYGKRLDRPNFGLLDPARFYSNSNNYSEGNPYLRPEIADNIELSHTFNNKLSTTLFLSKTKNGYGMVNTFDDVSNTQVTTFKNYYNNLSIGISESYTFNKYSWLESQLSVYLINSESKFYEDIINAELNNGFQFYFITNNSISFNSKKTIKGQVDFMYIPPYNEGLYKLDKSYSLDLGLNFDSILKDLDLTISVVDIFNTSRNLVTSNIDNVRQNFNVFPSNRFFRATISYSFGNNKINSKQRDFGNSEEKNRSN